MSGKGEGVSGKGKGMSGKGKGVSGKGKGMSGKGKGVSEKGKSLSPLHTPPPSPLPSHQERGTADARVRHPLHTMATCAAPTVALAAAADGGDGFAQANADEDRPGSLPVSESRAASSV
eukprot:275452-Chlamydomonas_euryale.AAC.1